MSDYFVRQVTIEGVLNGGTYNPVLIRCPFSRRNISAYVLCTTTNSNVYKVGEIIVCVREDVRPYDWSIKKLFIVLNGNRESQV